MNIIFIKGPKHFTTTNVLDYLKQCEPLFTMKGKQAPNYVFDLKKTEKCSMLGVLVIYKIIEFSLSKKCFNAPSIALGNPIILDLKKYGFWDLIMQFMADKDATEKTYRGLEIKVEDSFIIAPQALLRDSNFSSNSLKNKFLPKIEDYYSFNPKVVSMIFLCLSEVLLNFWEHAVDDTKSIIVANGNKQNIEIACADTGQGIVSTLSHVSGFEKLDPAKILSQSVKKGVTSKKKTNHMGYGLWILDQIVTLVKGRLHLYSQGAYYYNNFGKITSGSCANWEGTIIYLSLPLKDPKTLTDIEDYKEKNKLQQLKINWS